MKEKMPLPILDRHSRLESNAHNEAKGGEHTPGSLGLTQWVLVQMEIFQSSFWMEIFQWKFFGASDFVNVTLAPLC